MNLSYERSTQLFECIKQSAQTLSFSRRAPLLVIITDRVKAHSGYAYLIMLCLLNILEIERHNSLHKM